MNLGKEVVGRFFGLAMVGLLIAVGTLMAMIIPHSPLGLGKPGFAWTALLVGTGVLLFWSGVIGAIMSQVGEAVAARYHTVFTVTALHLFALWFFLWLAYSTYQEVGTELLFGGELVEGLGYVSTLAVLAALLALIMYYQATLYLLRVWRLYRSYRVPR